MKRNYNYKAFTPEEVKKGLLKDLLDYLVNYNTKSEKDYYDIHITTDGYCTIIEWTDLMYDKSFGEEPRFAFVDYDEVIMKEVNFPDNHTEYLFEDEVDERFKEWLEQNPGWVKTSYGTWTNEIENEKFRKMLVGDTEPVDLESVED